MTQPTTFSRDYLKNLPIEYKKFKIDTILRTHVQDIKTTAQHGYHLHVLDYDQLLRGVPTTSPPIIITVSDILEGLYRIFPDCTIEYKEDWLNTSPSTRIFKKGITIDWS